jgi:hypothetical protein
LKERKRRTGLRPRAGLLTLAVVVAATLVALVPSALSGNVTGAGFTTINPDADSGTLCLNGNPLVNCNLYTDKDFVWLNGGPNPAYVGDGTYFFAVLAPGGQHDPRDGSPNNLSDTTPDPWAAGDLNGDGSSIPIGDTYKNRTFTVSTDGDGNKVVSYTGNIGNVDPLDDETPHEFDHSKIRLMPYDDTPNNGGVYIMAICSLKDGYAAVTPSNCKYDAFKAEEGQTTVPEAQDPTVTKDAQGSYKTSWTWDLAKSVDKTRVDQNAGTNATFSYTVTATHSAGSNSEIKVTGKITVSNPNAESIEVSVSDALSNLTSCAVKDGATPITASDLITVPGAGDTGNRLTYSCSIGGTTVPDNLRNTVTVTWPEQILDDGSHLNGNSTGITYTYPNDGVSYIQFTQTKVDNCATLTDTFDGDLTTLGVACVGNSPVFAIGTGNTLAYFTSAYSSPTFTFTYRRTVTVPALQCRTYTNTVGFTTNTSSVHDINSTTVDTRSVVVCPKVNGLTIGYWQNKNGQARIIGTATTAGNCTALHDYLVQFNPFKDIDTVPISNTNSTLKYGTACGTSAGYTQNKSTASSGIAGYVYEIIKVANASGASMNVMLKAQMLATALNVYTGVTPGGQLIDLTKICHMIDSSAGTATCSGTYTNTSLYPAVFGGATSLTVTQILAYAANQSNAGGSIWYGNVKSVQEKAKDTFDAINNGVAVSA